MRKTLTALASLPIIGGCALETPDYDVNSFDAPDLETEVINGTPVGDHDRVPSGVVVTDSTGEKVGCSGTLIHPRMVLYAAHCVYFLGEDILIGHGFSDLEKKDGILYEPESVAAYHNYFPFEEYNHNDFGLVFLKEPIDSVIAPILPEDNYEEALCKNQNVLITGYGWNSERYGQFVFAQAPITKIVETEIVVGLDDLEAPNLCWGDSGGGTYLTFLNRDFVAGITSRPTPGESECSHGAVVGLPALVLDWIKKQCREKIGEGCDNFTEGDANNDFEIEEYSCEEFVEEEPVVMLDGPKCNSSGRNSNNFNLSNYLFLGAGLASLLRRRKK